MKKQILFTAVMISAILFSCSKEKIETPQETTGTPESITVAKPGLVINTLNIGLLGRYEFDGNLKDTTGQLEDAYPTVSRLPVQYAGDRKGYNKRAIYFNAKYGLDIFDVPSTPGGSSFSVWIKFDSIPTSSWLSVLNSWKAFSLQQYSNTFNCRFWNELDPVGQNYTSGSLNSFFWHHMVGTRDNSVMKFYVDGVLIGSSPTPAGTSNYFPLDNYNLGYGWGSYWKGRIDDLRFYKRVLTSSEVTQLYNL